MSQFDTINAIINFDKSIGNGSSQQGGSGTASTLSSVLTAGNTATNSIILNNGTEAGANVIRLLPNTSASITLTDGTNTNTIDKNGYTTLNSVQNSTHFLNFSDASANSVGAIQKNASISVNPSTFAFNVGSVLELDGVGGNGRVAIGIDAGAGAVTQGDNSVAIGAFAGNTQGTNAVSIGALAGQVTQSLQAVAVGNGAGQTFQGASSVAIGYVAGQANQGNESVAVGVLAGNITQGTQCVAIGYQAGENTQLNGCVAIGSDAGRFSQQSEAVAIGYFAGVESQGQGSVAIGQSAGNSTQGSSSVAIGQNAGSGNQKAFSVAIGAGAGQSGMGEYAIAIGNLAGNSSQSQKSICLNASDVALDNTAVEGLFIKPIRGVDHRIGIGIMRYDPTTSEVTYSTS